MQLINCRQCGKVCLDNPLQLCPDCAATRQAEEDKVLEYLREHAHASLVEICRETGVAEDIVTDMVRRGRLVNYQITYKCEVCGAPITSGRLCDKCSRNVVSQMPRAWGPRQQERPPVPRDKEQKMHIKDLIKRFKR